MKVLECQGISHSYDGARDAVSRLDLTIRPGRILALIGPNGAGKSTALRILATLQQPQRGRVTWDGADTWPSRHDLRRRIGFLGDGTALYPTMTAGEYLTFFADCYGLSPTTARVRVDETLETFELHPKRDARIRDLSKGMRQRLDVARTLLHRPELLLLDEPADGLDPRARHRLRDILRRTASEGVGIVVSSHILRELDDLTDEVALLQRGRLVVCGPLRDVIENYEVGRLLYEIRVVRGLGAAREVLTARGALVEGFDGGPDPDAGVVRARVRGNDHDAAALLRDIIAADAEVVSFTRLRSDLEEVYQSLGRDDAS